MTKYLIIPLLLISCAPDDYGRPKEPKGFDCEEVTVEVSKQYMALRIYKCTDKSSYTGNMEIKCYILASSLTNSIDENGVGRTSLQSQNSISCVR